MVKITDQESAEAWLRDKPSDVRIAFAARCALRVLPGIGRAHHSTLSTIALAVLRAALTSGVAVRTSPPEIEKASISAHASERDILTMLSTSNVPYSIPHSAADSAFHAANSITSYSYRPSLSAYSAGRFATDAAAYDAAASTDAELLETSTPEKVLRIPLWPVDTMPMGLCTAHDRLRAFWDTAPKTWDFWRDWYQGMLVGRPPDWTLQERIALIPDDEWKKGAVHIARLIEEIQAAYLAETAPLAETVEINPHSGKFRTVPVPLQNPGLIGAMVARTEDCLEDALHGRNGLREDMGEVRKLRRTHQRYANDPQQIELNYTSVAVSLRRQIEDTGELSKSEDNLSLLEAVEEGALAIRAHHPEIEANRKSIARQKLRELDQDGIDLLEDARPVLAAISEDVMQEDFERDIPQLINDATLPLPSGAPPLPGVDESMRIFSRVSKMKLRYDEMTRKGAELFDSKEFKTVRLGLTVVSLLSALVSLGLFLFGVL